MQDNNSNTTAYSLTRFYEIRTISVLGDRDEQQDAYGMIVNDNCGIVVVCDGMGGYAGGKLASNTAVQTILNRYAQMGNVVRYIEELQAIMSEANDAVRNIKRDNPGISQAGTTCVFVYLSGQEMYWCSAGDSRAYIYRGGRYTQITQDHIYKTVLDGKLDGGVISQAQYNSEICKGEALINYLGYDELKLMDYNSKPFILRSGDRIVLTSDGLYKYLEENEIFDIINNFVDINEAIQALDVKVRKKVRDNGKARDNMTVTIIGVR